MVTDKIKKAREKKGWSQSEMAAKIGIGLRHYQNIEAGQFPKYKRHQIEEIEKILGISIYEEIYAENVPHETSDPPVPYQQKRNQQKLTGSRSRIPFYDADAAAGPDAVDMSPINAPAGTIDVGDLLSDSTAAMRVYGNSMLPNYPPGSGKVSPHKRNVRPGCRGDESGRNQKESKRIHPKVKFSSPKNFSKPGLRRDYYSPII